MTFWLRLTTSVNVMVGPFVDRSNAYDEETGLTLSVELSKNGATWAVSGGGNGSHAKEGWYTVPLNSVDTDTVGRLKLKAHENATALPVWENFMVVPSGTYDIFATGLDTMIQTQCDQALVGQRLDEVINAAADGNPTVSSFMDKLMNTGGTQTFDRTTDSLEAMRNRGDAAWTTGGAGLSTGDVSAAVERVVSANHLDHLLLTSAPAGVPVSNTVMEKIMVSSAGGVFSAASHSLKAIRQRGDAAWITATGFGTQAHIESARAALSTDIAGLTDVSSADVSNAVKNNITNYHLDHLLHTSAPAGVPVSNAVMDVLMVSAAGTTFSRTANSLRAIADKADAAAAAGGATLASIQAGVWHYSLSAGMATGQAGYILQSAAANAGTTVSGAVTSGDISNIGDTVWQKLRSTSGIAPSGSFGQAITFFYGSGDVPVNHNTGGSNNLQAIDSGGSGVDQVNIRIYLKSNYDSGLTTIDYIVGQSITDSNGQWKHPVYLDSGVAYTIVYSKPGSYETTTKDYTV